MNAPCPFCNSRDTMIVSVRMREFRVRCGNMNCRAAGPIRKDVIQARVAWNNCADNSNPNEVKEVAPCVSSQMSETK